MVAGASRAPAVLGPEGPRSVLIGCFYPDGFALLASLREPACTRVVQRVVWRVLHPQSPPARSLRKTFFEIAEIELV